MSLQTVTVLLVGLVAITLAVPINEDSNVVWFPNPASKNGDDLIPGYLTRPAGHVQEETDLSKAHFLLYTKSNKENPDEIFLDDLASLEKSHFKKGGGLKFMSHGFGGGIDHTFPWELRGEFLSENFDDDNVNVILLDWSELSDSPDYVGAVTNAYAVSNLTADLLQFILKEEYTTLDKVHFIGYSLGGQVVGIAANRFTQRSGEKIPRVTALDPAFPLFDLADDIDRISPDDAEFVDVVHSAGGTLGMVQPRGHVDFYPNGGSKQPGCGVDVVGSCSHGRAPAYYTESLFGEKVFKATLCDTWENYQTGACDDNGETANLGYDVDQTKRGKFYLLTNEEEPYAMG